MSDTIESHRICSKCRMEIEGFRWMTIGSNFYHPTCIPDGSPGPDYTNAGTNNIFIGKMQQRISALEQENALLKQTVEMLKMGRPLDGIDRQRARELEAKLAAAEAEIERLAKLDCSCSEVIQLRAENAALQKRIQSDCDLINKKSHRITELSEQLSRAEAALREIEEHPDCHLSLDSEYYVTELEHREVFGRVDAHRKCAAIARKWREGK